MKALVEPHRRQILTLVRERELSAGAIAERFRITRSAVSQHLTVLKDAGLVAERRDGTRRFYRAEPRPLVGLREYLDEFWDRRLARLRREAEAEEGQARIRECISVAKEIDIVARPDTIWELLSNPDEATRWMGLSAAFDLRTGGGYRVEVLPGLFASGEFLEIDPPRRLVHTWGWEVAGGGPVLPGSTLVVWELLDDGERTRLRLSHRDLPSLATAGSHARGWTHYLGRLAAIAVGGNAGPDPWAADPERMREELRPASGGATG